MKKLSFTGLFVLAFAIFSFGKQIPSDRAKIAAYNFLTQIKPGIGINNTLDLIYTAGEKAEITNGNSSSTNYFYVFSFNNNQGFVIISADDRVIPILGYSLENRFETNNIPSHVDQWLQDYSKQIKSVIESNILATKEIEEQWNELFLNNPTKEKLNKKGSSYYNLIKSNWDQWPYYNDLCPYDDVVGRRVPSGCVATAMAMVLKYWDYPAKGKGSRSYTHFKYGKLSANFGAQSYDWFNMPNRVISSKDSIVSTLIYHCGVSIDMIYDVNGSGGYPSEIPYSFINYFGYSNTAQWIRRSGKTDSAWISLLKTEFDNGRPVIYSGAQSDLNNGHCFIADGYDKSYLMHFNWGWNGRYNGYYTINSLNPGSSTFSYYASIVSGIEPANSGQYYKLNLTKDVKASVSEMEYGKSFSVSTNIKNNGSNTFKGRYYAMLEDRNGKIVAIVDSISETNGLTTNGSYSNGLTFNYKGGFNLLPGKYILSIYQKANGGYFRRIHSINQSILDQCEIVIKYDHFMELNSEVVLTPQVLVTGFASTAKLNLINKSEATFKGQYRTCLYKLDSSLTEVIDVKNESNGLAASGTYNSPFISFSKTVLSSVSGEYYFVTEFKPDTSNIWIFAGSRYFKNHKKVYVVDPPKPDKYEVNNTSSQAYSLPLVFNNFKANVTTEDASCHKMSDYDYYKIVLPAGKKYEITPRLYDLYTAGNDKVYSLDVFFSYSKGGNIWSNPYDSILPAPITSNGGETYYFLVYGSPLDQTGTYRLNLDIKIASDAKEIVKFSVNTIPGTIDSKASKILVYLDEQTNITALAPVISISEFARISPGSEVIRDFTNPIQYTVTAQDSSVKTWTVSVLKSLTAIRESFKTNRSILIYPNPAKDQVIVELVGGEYKATKIQCLDIHGVNLPVDNTYEGNQMYRINTKEFRSGLYFIQVINNSGWEYRKFEIQK